MFVSTCYSWVLFQLELQYKVKTTNETVGNTSMENISRHILQDLSVTVLDYCFSLIHCQTIFKCVYDISLLLLHFLSTIQDMLCD